jgi:hypothetical protein
MSKKPKPPDEPADPSGQGRRAGSEGVWELTLWNGAVRFSEWFYYRLHWPTEVKRKRLEDLRPHLPAGAWEALLLAIRGHLEQGRPLDTKICVQLAPGRSEWWQVQGVAQRDNAGHPVYLAGTMRSVDAPPPDASDAGI